MQAPGLAPSTRPPHPHRLSRSHKPNRPKCSSNPTPPLLTHLPWVPMPPRPPHPQYPFPPQPSPYSQHFPHPHLHPHPPHPHAYPHTPPPATSSCTTTATSHTIRTTCLRRGTIPMLGLALGPTRYRRPLCSTQHRVWAHVSLPMDHRDLIWVALWF